MYSENRKKFRMCVSTAKAFHNTLTYIATRVSCQSLWHLSETKDNHLQSQQTSNTDMLILSYSHILIKKNIFNHKNPLLPLTHIYSVLYQPVGPMSSLLGNTFCVCCLNLFLLGLSSMKLRQLVSQVSRPYQISPWGEETPNCTTASVSVIDNLCFFSYFQDSPAASGVLMLCFVK